MGGRGYRGIIYDLPYCIRCINLRISYLHSFNNSSIFVMEGNNVLKQSIFGGKHLKISIIVDFFLKIIGSSFPVNIIGITL